MIGFLSLTQQTMDTAHQNYMFITTENPSDKQGSECYEYISRYNEDNNENMQLMTCYLPYKYKSVTDTYVHLG